MYYNCGMDAKSRLGLVSSRSLPLDRNPAAVYLATLKASGRRPQKHALDTIAKLLTGGAGDCFHLDWSRLRYQHTAAVRTWLMDHYKPATANRALCALRGVLKQAWLLNQMSAEDYHRAALVKAVNGETLPAGRELSPGEITALLTDCQNDPTPAGRRDAAVIAILYAAGLRREEAINLDLEDYDPDTRRLIVHGKRSKERTAYLVSGAIGAMDDWLNFRGESDGPLFLAINRAGHISIGRRMTTQAIYNLLVKRAARAGVKNFSPHDLRRTFVSDLLEAGADIATVAKMAGHANVQTTARYDRRPEEAKQRAAELLHVPYRKGIHYIKDVAAFYSLC
jgi:site-specific recombinase XerD